MSSLRPSFNDPWLFFRNAFRFQDSLCYANRETGSFGLGPIFLFPSLSLFFLLIFSEYSICIFRLLHFFSPSTPTFVITGVFSISMATSSGFVLLRSIHQSSTYNMKILAWYSSGSSIYLSDCTLCSLCSFLLLVLSSSHFSLPFVFELKHYKDLAFLEYVRFVFSVIVVLLVCDQLMLSLFCILSSQKVAKPLLIQFQKTTILPAHNEQISIFTEQMLCYESHYSQETVDPILLNSRSQFLLRTSLPDLSTLLLLLPLNHLKKVSVLIFPICDQSNEQWINFCCFRSQLAVFE